MIGVISFVIAAMAFCIFAITSNNAKFRKISNLRIIPFANAYLIMMLASICWAYAIYKNKYEITLGSVLIGDFLIMMATLFLLESFVSQKRIKLVQSFAITIGSILLAFRLFIIRPDPTITNGILEFKTQFIVFVILAIILLIIWINANIRFGRSIIKFNAKTNLQRNNITSTEKNNDFIAPPGRFLWPCWIISNVLLFVGFCSFMIAKNPIFIATGFFAIIISLVSMSTINYYRLVEL